MRQQVDTLFTGGSVFSPRLGRPGPRWRSPWSEGRISAVGPEAELAALAGPGTDVVDLAGGLLIPGFQDAHVHPVMGGLEMRQCELHGTTSAQEYLDSIAAYAAANPDLEWIVGGGWSMESFPGGTPDPASRSTRSCPTARSS